MYNTHSRSSPSLFLRLAFPLATSPESAEITSCVSLFKPPHSQTIPMAPRICFGATSATYVGPTTAPMPPPQPTRIRPTYICATLPFDVSWRTKPCGQHGHRSTCKNKDRAPDLQCFLPPQSFKAQKRRHRADNAPNGTQAANRALHVGDVLWRVVARSEPEAAHKRLLHYHTSNRPKVNS